MNTIDFLVFLKIILSRFFDDNSAPYFVEVVVLMSHLEKKNKFKEFQLFRMDQVIMKRMVFFLALANSLSDFNSHSSNNFPVIHEFLFVL